MKNRYGDFYEFKKVGDNTYTIVGNLKYWRFGGRDYGDSRHNGIDTNDLGFVDPSGGPFIGVGSYKIDGKTVSRIYTAEGQILFKVSDEVQ